MFIIRSPVELPDVTLKGPGEILRKPLTQEYLSAKRRRLTSKDAQLLTKQEIKKLLRECKITA
jgi:hypothetical protein